MDEAGRSPAVGGAVTDEDVVRIAAGCALACRFCPHSYGRSGDPVERVLAPDHPIPQAHRITILAGNCLDATFAPVVRRAREAGTQEVRVYAHAGIRSPEDLGALRDAGMTGLHLMLPAARRDLLASLTGGCGSLSRTAALLDAANALGLGVFVEVPVVVRSVPDLPDTVRRALNRIARPEGVTLRFLAEFDPARGAVPWDPGVSRDAVAACISEARSRRVPLSLAHPEAPPACLLDLPAVVPETYPTLSSSAPGSASKPFDACTRCAVARVCPADGTYLRAGDVVPRPLAARPAGVSRAKPAAEAGLGGGGDTAAGVASRGRGAVAPPPLAKDPATSATLFLRRAALEPLLDEFRARRPLCRFPWEALEAHDIRGVVAPCAGGWPLERATLACSSWRDLGLIGAWNAPGLQAFRRAIAARDPHRTCKPECPAFHGGPQSALPPLAPATTRVFHDNLVRNLREMLDGAEVLRSRPLTISLSPTFRCPNHCRMCDIHEMRDRMGPDPALYDMNEALFEELRDLLPTTRLLALTGGEPLVSRRLRDLLREFDAERFPDGAVTLTTNGLLLRGAVLRDLARTRFRLVIVSLNAATEATYEAITGTRGGFPRVLRNLRDLVEAAPHMAGRPAIVASFVAMRSNLSELPAFLDLARDIGCGVRLLPVERDRCGESLFTDEDTLSRAVAFVDQRVRPLANAHPHAVRAEVARLGSILRSRLARRDFTPL